MAVMVGCDLHVNKQFKGNMGANFTETASTRAARSVTAISHLVESFDSQFGIHPESSAQRRSIVTALQNQKSPDRATMSQWIQEYDSQLYEGQLYEAGGMDCQKVKITSTCTDTCTPYDVHLMNWRLLTSDIDFDSL